MTSNHYRDDHSAKKSFRSECPFARKEESWRRGREAGGRVGRQTDRPPEAREERKEGAVVPFLLRTSPASSVPPSFSGLPFSPPVFPDVPSVHPSIHPGYSFTASNGVEHISGMFFQLTGTKRRRRKREEGIGGSSRSKSWSFEFPPFPLSLVSPIAISQTRFPPPSFPPSAADRRAGILFTVAPSSSEYLFCRAIFQADRPTGFLPSRWRWSE